MLEQLITVFGEERVKKCLSSHNETSFYVAENLKTKRSYVLVALNDINEEECFKVVNLGNQPVHFLAIDECFLTEKYGYTDKKCDFIVFNDTKICFVELKTNVKRRNKVKERLRTAKKQLAATINFFREYIDLSSYQLEAIYVLRKKFYLAQRGEMKLDFYNTYEVTLEGTNTTTFNTRPKT